MYVQYKSEPLKKAEMLCGFIYWSPFFKRPYLKCINGASDHPHGYYRIDMAIVGRRGACYKKSLIWDNVRGEDITYVCTI